MAVEKTAPTSTKITGRARALLGAELRLAYERGASVREISARIGRAYGTTHMILAEAGVVFRKPGGRRGRRRRGEGR